MTGVLGTSGGGAAGVTSVTAGNGITVTGTTTPTIAASLAAGTGVSIAGTTTLTVSATGVNSVSAGTGISVSGTTSLTVSATGVNSVSAGTGISVSGSTSLTVTNTGVTSLVAGTNVSVSGATGAVTVNAPAFGTTITASTIGGTAAAGTSTTVAREDHKHAFPAGAAPSSLLVASTQATGTSASPALADHVHAMPGSAVAGASAVGDTAATGSATTVALSDHRHSREAFGTPVVVNGQTTSLATGSLTTLARADHVHTVSNVPVLLASTTLTSGAISYSFTSIPSTYKHLELSYMGKSVHSSSNDPDLMYLQFNGDTGANYRSSFGPSTPRTSSPIVGLINSATSFLSSQPCEGTIRIYHYANTTNGWYKQAINTWNYEAGFSAGSAYTAVWYESWDITNTAISTVTINLIRANWAVGTHFSLYGIP